MVEGASFEIREKQQQMWVGVAPNTGREPRSLETFEVYTCEVCVLLCQ